MSKKKNTNNQKSTKPNNNQTNELEIIANKMDEISRRRLPDGVIRYGMLQGMEPEIRQEALIMSVCGFLEQNTAYADARKKNDIRAIETSMEKCMAIALSIVKRRLASQRTHELARNRQFNEGHGETVLHPSQTNPCDWTADVKATVIMRSIVKAVRYGKISVPNALIVSMILQRGISVAKVAVAAGITRSAVYQQLWRIKRILPEVMDEVEIDLS